MRTLDANERAAVAAGLWTPEEQCDCVSCQNHERPAPKIGDPGVVVYVLQKMRATVQWIGPFCEVTLPIPAVATNHNERGTSDLGIAEALILALCDRYARTHKDGDKSS